MLVKPIKTEKIIPGKDNNIFLILEKHLPRLKEKSVVAITSKIIAICQQRVADPEKIDKDELIKQEAAMYIPRRENKWGFLLTIKKDTLIASAGIDESNAAGNYILWPKDPQRSANDIRAFLKKKFRLENLGVIITDSKVTPLRRGVTGVSIAHSGFTALNDYRGKPDIFGRKLKVTQANVAEGLAGAAVLVMGEGKEQTPVCVIEGIPFVKFQKKDPSKKDLSYLELNPKEDIYGKILMSVKWKKGKSR